MRSRRKVGRLAAAMIVVLLLAGSPAVAEQPTPPAAPISVWTYTLYKTITYETWVNLADIPLYTYFVAGPAAGTGRWRGCSGESLRRALRRARRAGRSPAPSR